MATAGASDPLSEALAVLDAFMAALNRGDEAGINATFHFPHVRLASGKVTPDRPPPRRTWNVPA